MPPTAALFALFDAGRCARLTPIDGLERTADALTHNGRRRPAMQSAPASSGPAVTSGSIHTRP